MSLIEQFGFTGTERTLINPVKKNTVKREKGQKSWKQMTDKERVALREKVAKSSMDEQWNKHVYAMVDRVLEVLPEGVCPPLIHARDAACYV